MGFSSATTSGQSTICLEGTPISVVTIETCGTGAGFIHHESGTDLVHVRAKWNLITKDFPQSTIKGQFGFDFSELQLDTDEVGFQFTGTGVETAGPELSASVQWFRMFGTHRTRNGSKYRKRFFLLWS